MKQQGFTLLELSIVLVIIGLIIGGITVGADMIRSAELNSVVSDINKYKTAVNTYRLKYNALPGDHKNATAYWGAAAGCPNNTSGGSGTCDGDNNDGVTRPFSSSLEPALFWQHLSLSEIIPGSYTGEYTSGSLTSEWFTAGENLPEGPISGSASNCGSVKYDVSFFIYYYISISCCLF